VSRENLITIDGPSGSGKGTVARRVADRLGWHLLDSGALYRLVGLEAYRGGIVATDHPRLSEAAANLDVRFGMDASGHEQIWLRNEEVSGLIRTEAAGERASQVAAVAGVRDALLDRQRRFARPPGLVADGRDMGTVVFPNAPLKVYLTATAEERAKRRYNQLKHKGTGGSLPALFEPGLFEPNLFAQISREVAERDHRDLNRPIAPLRPAADAVIVDSTTMTIEAVVEQVLALWAEAGTT
jgi:cytidylate kinase